MIGYPIGVPKGYPMPYPNRGRIAHTRIARTGPYRPGPYRTPTTPARLHHSVAVGNAREPINAMMRCAEPSSPPACPVCFLTHPQGRCDR